MKFTNSTKRKIIIVIMLIIILILIFIYGNIIRRHIASNRFAKNCVEIYQNNEEPVFNIEKILVCSSANAIDLSEEQNLQNLNIYQYTDIAIYINNGDELSNKNTVKELFIDNIELEGDENIGSKSLTYKNMLNFGLKQKIKQNRQTSDIKFNVVQTNQQDDEANYDNATFYTDCSNPITLEYLNYNLVNNYQMEKNNSVLFDGSILEKAGITTQNLNCKVKFKINIVNNENNNYSCWVNFNLPLEDINKGTTMKSMQTKGSKYNFFRH